DILRADSERQADCENATGRGAGEEVHTIDKRHFLVQALDDQRREVPTNPAAVAGEDQVGRRRTGRLAVPAIRRARPLKCASKSNSGSRGLEGAASSDLLHELASPCIKFAPRATRMPSALAQMPPPPVNSSSTSSGRRMFSSAKAFMS